MKPMQKKMRARVGVSQNTNDMGLSILKEDVNWVYSQVALTQSTEGA